MASRKVLVITGDYAVVQRVKEALNGRNFVVHTAYSHVDAVYQLRFEAFELVLVDAAMVSHKSGERTASTVMQMEKRPPLLIYAPRSSNGWPSEAVIATLDAETLYRSVAQTLRLAPIKPELASTEQTPESDTPSPTSIFWRDDEMQTLFALGRSLTEVLDLSEVLNRIVAAGRSLTDAEEGMILLPDGQTGQLYLRAKVGIDQEVANNFRIKTQDTIAGAVFESGQPLLLGESGPQKVKTEYFVNSLLYVPIIHKGQTLGVLGVNNKNKHDPFSERHRDLLINLASYAAIAIENARAHGQSIRRQHELKALIDASQAINASLSFGRTLPTICEQLSRVLNVQQAAMFSWDANDRTLHLLARHQQTSWRGSRDPIIRLAERPYLRPALESRRFSFIRHDRHEKRSTVNRLGEVGASALLIIPINAGEQVLGIVEAYYVETLEQTPPADVIYRAQRLMLELLAGLKSSDDDSRAFRALQDVRALLGADWIEFAEMLAEGGSLHLLYCVGSSVWVDEPRPVILIDDTDEIFDALNRQQPINRCSGEDDLSPDMRSLLHMTMGRALLALPLIARGQTVGLTVFVDAAHTRTFSAREIDLGRAIVGQAATAFENVNLVRDLEVSLDELREAQNRLIQSARLSAMGEMAAAVAHQVNNPLTTIVLDTELLLENEPTDTKEYEVLNAILRSGKRAAAVVRRLLAMSGPSAPDATRAPIDVIYTIEDIVTLVQPHIEREGIRLTLQLSEDELPAVMAVPGELNDVWMNLILNAHDAVIGQPNAEIGVSTAYDTANAVVEVDVWDNGHGIPEEYLEEIFKPFFTTKPKGEGTGLGLHICRQVVDRVGGTITVQTSASGTRFSVRLPIMRST
ncbi:MAG TPA: GAF domain-containing protein [Phototrophicaceae bacterium]|nr:GAF domain-containing protein [Phototrophicaceae bacterium]